MSKRSAYVEKMKLELDELNAQINKFEGKVQEAKDDVRHKYQEEMRKLRYQSKLATTKLAELKAASEETWDNMVAEMEKMRDAFTHSFHYLQSQL